MRLCTYFQTEWKDFSSRSRRLIKWFLLSFKRWKQATIKVTEMILTVRVILTTAVLKARKTYKHLQPATRMMIPMRVRVSLTVVLMGKRNLNHQQIKKSNVKITIVLITIISVTMVNLMMLKATMTQTLITKVATTLPATAPTCTHRPV